MKNYKWLIIFILIVTSGSFILYKYISSNTVTENKVLSFLQNNALCYKYIKNDTTKNELFEYIAGSKLIQEAKHNGYIMSYHSPQLGKIATTVWIPISDSYSLKNDSTITGEWTKNLLTININQNKKEFIVDGNNFVALSFCGNCLVETTKQITFKKNTIDSLKNNTLYGNIENINKFVSYKKQSNIILKLISKGKFSITKQGNNNGLFYQAKIDSIKPFINNTPNKFPKIITKNTVAAITLNLCYKNTNLRINNSTNELWNIEEKYQINIRQAFKAWFTGTISYLLYNKDDLSEIAVFDLKPNVAPYEQMPELFSTVSYNLNSNNQNLFDIDIKQLRIRDLDKVIFKKTKSSNNLYSAIYNEKLIVCSSIDTLILYINELNKGNTRKCSINNFCDFGYYVNTRLLLDSYYKKSNILNKSFIDIAKKLLSKTNYIIGEGLFSTNKILIQGSIRLQQ